MFSYRYSHGMALPVVLWIFLLLSLMFSAYSYSVRTETAITQQLINSARTRAAADAAVHMAIERLLSEDSEYETSADDSVYEDTFDEITLRVAVINESGRIDLNKAPEELLDILLQSFTASEEERIVVLDSLLDWRDEDNEPRPYGAEDDEYAAMGLPYGAADADMTSVEEFALVNGVTPELFKALRGMVTVYSGAVKLNPAMASSKLLMALSGYSEVNAERLQQQWKENELEDNADLMANIPATLISNRVGNVYTIEVEASMPESTKTRLASVIKLVGDKNNPYTLVSWKEVENLDFIN